MGEKGKIERGREVRERESAGRDKGAEGTVREGERRAIGLCTGNDTQ